MYKESNFLKGLLTDLLDDAYPLKEVFVIIDEPTEKSLSLAKEFRNRVSFILNKVRVGKANALNNTEKRADGDVLLFLDSDVQLQDKEDSFLKVLEREMQGVNIIDIKKCTPRTSFLSTLVNYEYLSSSLTSFFFSKIVKKSLGLNGAAFAIRREAFEKLGGFRRSFNDDFDLITRSFMKNLSFKYTNKVSVSIKPQSSWREWYKQRKRWGVATGVWLKDYHRPLARVLAKSPQTVLTALILLMPSLLLFLLNFTVPDFIFYNFLILASSIVPKIANIALIPLLLVPFGLSLTKYIILTAATYSALASIYYLAARKLGYPFNPFEFLFYYIVYSPISLSMHILGIVRVLFNKSMADLDWKL
ncbi:MAG: poly-beta,6-N-acetyl-D-glucosamine synthase [Thermoproteota archaeon]|nr:poly-beta,6-N-acetyl-D-glucosamine synthase [Thermoproteota archaeon]